MLENITVSPAPHISKAHSTRSVMGDVLIGLAPAMIAACWYFREKAAITIAVCVVSCMAAEWICNRLLNRSNSLGDLSAVVTGVILAMSLPPAIPIWATATGGVIAIVIGKMVFGGLGSNTFNPAMVARTIMALSLGSLMTTWTVPAPIDAEMSDVNINQVTAVTQATPLAWSKDAINNDQVKADVVEQQLPSAFTGNVAGCLGETSALALLIGGIYLIIRRTIALHIPLSAIAAVLVFAGIGFLVKSESYISPWMHLSTGGMLLCVFFIATDPVTAPLTKKGMWIFGAGIGSLIMLIRMFGNYPEGVMFAVLIMNSISPLIDRFCKLIPAGGKANG